MIRPALMAASTARAGEQCERAASGEDVGVADPAAGGDDERRRARELGRRLALGLPDLSTDRAAHADGPVDVLDLFCGCGGLSAGFELVGRAIPSYRLVGAADIDQAATETYAANLPIVPARVDLATVSAKPDRIDAFLASLPRRPGARTVLVGGPPCQGFSAHRKKDGKPKDERNALVCAYARFAVRLRPEIVVMENVPEILAKKDFVQFEAFRESLENAGYTVQAAIHNLGTFGVPQERFRALVVAARVPFEMPAGFLSPTEFRTVRDAIGHLPRVKPGKPSVTDAQHQCTHHRQSTIETIRRVPLDGGRRPDGVGPPCLHRVDGFRDVYGRLYWDRPSNTITGYARNPASGRYVHPEQHRGLTIREAALLQGFPAHYTFAGPFDHRFMQIGNAVPPTFAAYLAAHIWGELSASNAHQAVVRPTRTVVVPTSNSFSSGIAGRKRGRNRGCSVTLL